jgi:hypothetical protein
VHRLELSIAAAVVSTEHSIQRGPARDRGKRFIETSQRGRTSGPVRSNGYDWCADCTSNHCHGESGERGRRGQTDEFRRSARTVAVANARGLHGRYGGRKGASVRDRSEDRGRVGVDKGHRDEVRFATS